MNKPMLYIMIGLSGSGKSTYAKKIADENDAVIVSSDSIRAEICEGGINDQSKNDKVFEIFHKRIKENLQNGKDVVADATNITMKSRKPLFQIAKKKDVNANVMGIMINIPYEECLTNNSSRDRKIPEEVIKKQLYRFEVPFKEEGFDEILLTDSRTYNYNDYLAQMIGFDQKNPHHKYHLLPHCIRTKAELLNIDNYCMIEAAEIHDIGKLFTQTFDDNGIAHYYQHHNVGAYYVLSNTRKCLNYELLDIVFFINYHMLPFFWKKEKTKEKYKRIFGEEKYNLLMTLHEADKKASGTERSN